MYQHTDKKNLYWIIEMYLAGEIDSSIFEHEFYCTYNLELNSLKLTNKEYKAFHDLSEIVGRFSELEEDHKRYPGVYYTEVELREKVKETQGKLNKTLNDVIEEELKVYDHTVKKSATVLDKAWLMCPDCKDAWESTSKNAMVICPKCNQVLHNPKWEKHSGEECFHQP